MPVLGVSKIVRTLSDDGIETSAERFEKRYPDVDLGQKLISLLSLKKLLFEGWLDSDVIKKEIDESPPFLDPDATPAWRRVCGLWRNSDDELASAVAELQRQFVQREFEDVGQLFLLFGVWLLLSGIGVTNWSRKEVVSQCKSYLRDLEKTNRVLVFTGGWQLNYFLGWGGFAYVETESIEFKELVDYFKIIAARVYRKALPRLASELIELMKRDPMTYARRLSANNVERAVYSNVPILASVKVKTFVDALLGVDPNSQSMIFGVMKSRYEHGALGLELSGEREWLARVKRELERRAKRLPPLSRYRIQSSVKIYIDPLVVVPTAPVAAGVLGRPMSGQGVNG
jgi:hypothetical protein